MNLGERDQPLFVTLTAMLPRQGIFNPLIAVTGYSLFMSSTCNDGYPTINRPDDKKRFNIEHFLKNNLVYKHETLNHCWFNVRSSSVTMTHIN